MGSGVPGPGSDLSAGADRSGKAGSTAAPVTPHLLPRRLRDSPSVPLGIAAVVALIGALVGLVEGASTTTVDTAVRAGIATAPPRQRDVQVSVRRDGADPEGQDVPVRAALERALGHGGTGIWTSARGELLPIVSGARNLPPDGARLVPWTGADVSGHARLVAGRWPAATNPAATNPAATGRAGTLEAALQSDAARRLGIRSGDRLRLGATDSSSPAPPEVVVVGLWRADDATDPYWFADPLETTGIERAGVLGPLVLPVGAMEALPVRWQQRWRAAGDPDRISAGDLAGLASRLAGLRDALADVPAAGGAPATVDGGLPALAAAQAVAARDGQASGAALLAVLAVLAAACCLVAGTLLADLRAEEATLLRARGAGPARRLTTALAEGAAVGLLAAVPAAAAGALATTVAAAPRAGRSGPTGASVLPGALVAAAVAVLAAVLVLVTAEFPPGRGARAGGDRSTDAETSGGGSRSGTAAGLVLLALGGTAVWQLHRAGSAGARLAGGRIDPVVVAALPVAVMAAGVAVVTVLRAALLPLGTLDRQRRLLPAMVGWHVARRAARPVIPVVVLAAATAAAVCALSAGATVHDVEVARAADGVGTGLVVRVDRPSGPDVLGPDPGRLEIGPALAAVPAAATVMPVARLAGQVAGSDVTVLAVGSENLVRATAPAADARVRDTPAVRALGGSPPATVPLPAGATRLSVTVTAVAASGTLPAPAHPLAVSALVSGEDTVPVRVPLGTVRADGHTVRLTAALPAGTRGLAGLELAATARADRREAARVRLAMAVGGPGPDAATEPLAVPGWQVAGEGPPRHPLLLLQGQGTDPVTVQLWTEPANGVGAVARLVPAGGTDSPLPALVDRRVSAAIDGGDTTLLTLDDRSVPITVVGVVDLLPGLSPDPAPGTASVGAPPPPGILVDLGGLAGRDLRAGATPPVPDEWWVAGPAADGSGPDAQALRDAAATAGRESAAQSPRAQAPAAQSSPAERRIVQLRSRAAAVVEALAQPQAAGLRRLLLIAALAVGLVAVAAAVLGDVVAGRRRRAELAVLRCLGASDRQVRRLLLGEQGVVLGPAGIAGAAAGVLLARPAVAVLAGPVLPSGSGAVLQVSVPLAASVLLPVMLLAVVSLSAAVRGRPAARADVARVLREEVR